MSDLNNKNLKGAFFDSLNRNNRKIKRDRAVAITEDAQLLYKREIEDMEMQLKRLNRERDGMLDLSPTTADSLVLASDFDGKAFVSKDLDIGLKVRNLEIKLEIGKRRYALLFETEVDPSVIAASEALTE